LLAMLTTRYPVKPRCSYRQQTERRPAAPTGSCLFSEAKPVHRLRQFPRQRRQVIRRRGCRHRQIFVGAGLLAMLTTRYPVKPRCSYRRQAGSYRVVFIFRDETGPPTVTTSPPAPTGHPSSRVPSPTNTCRSRLAGDADNAVSRPTALLPSPASRLLQGCVYFQRRNRSTDCDNFPASADRSSVVEGAVTDKYL